MIEQKVCIIEGTSGPSTDDGGAVPEGQIQDPLPWHVLWVKSRAEKAVRDALQRDGFEAFVATKHEMHIWRRGEQREVEKVLIPSVVFVRFKKTDRLKVERQLNVVALMRDPARKGTRTKGGDEFAVISDDEMQLFQQMLTQPDTEVKFTSTDFSVGEHVRIKDFDPKHSVAQIVRIFGDSKTYVGLRVTFLGCAYVEMPLDRIIKIKV